MKERKEKGTMRTTYTVYYDEDTDTTNPGWVTCKTVTKDAEIVHQDTELLEAETLQVAFLEAAQHWGVHRDLVTYIE